MNKEIKKEWIEALRSGEYVQGKTLLKKRRRDGSSQYCCLGVLCDIYNKKGMGEWVQENSFGEYYSYKGLTTMSIFLPGSISNKAKIFANTQKHLAQMNDNGHSFMEIADWIENEL